MNETYKPGELFVYTNGSHWELGQVKSVAVEGEAYFCWYSTGDTAARTPVENMHKLENAGFSHAECVTLGWLLDHMALMTPVCVQEEDDPDADLLFEGYAMLCPDEIRTRIIVDVMPDVYLDRCFFFVTVR